MLNFKRLSNLTLINVLLKLIGFGLILWSIDSLSNSFSLSDTQIALIALILTIIGGVADLIVLPHYGNLPSLLMGFPVMVIIIWLVPLFLPGGHINLVWASLAAIIIAPVEYLLHRMVLRSLSIE